MNLKTNSKINIKKAKYLPTTYSIGNYNLSLRSYGDYKLEWDNRNGKYQSIDNISIEDLLLIKTMIDTAIEETKND